MYDWISELKPGQWVLDLASGTGSFAYSSCAGSVVALDEDKDAFQMAAPLPEGPYHRTFGRSGSLPFRDGAFDLVICHHALEHIENLESSLKEIRRVLKTNGRLFVSVPNGYGLCDFVYRTVFEGGGHVNRFHRDDLVAVVERCVDLRLIRWTKLYSSFVYLRRLMELLEAPPPGLPKRLMRIGRLPRWTIGSSQKSLYSASRALDRWLRTDLAVYGWAFYFDSSKETAAPVQEPAYMNVCLYCGAGQPAAGMERTSRRSYRCAACSRVTSFYRPFRDTA
jgi:SAM-dependent methyltransferase